MNLSRLTDKVNPAAAKVALRAAIFMPICLLLATELIGGAAQPFAAFGAFVLLAMVTFAGRPVPRLFAWIGLVLVGCVFIVIGTLLSESTVLAALAAGLISFLVFFSGVVNQYFAAARTAAVLLIALPLMVEANSAAVDERLAGWLLACAICIPATYLFWRLPWYGGLRKQAAAASRALAGLVRDPTCGEAGDRASKEVWKLRKLFLSTPNRPTGASGVSAAIANLVDEQAWTYGLVVNPGGGIISDSPYARDLREATADLLEATSDVLLNRKDRLSVDTTDRALRKLIEQNTADLRKQAEKVGRSGEAQTIEHLDHEFRLRKLAYSAIDIAETAEVASGSSAAPGTLGHLWSWAELGRTRAVGAGRMMARHAGFNSSWLRNSIRGAIGIGLAVLVADLVAVQNAFWVVLGTLSILRSNALGTRGSVVQALLGTLVGIILGAVVIWLFGSEVHILWAALPLAVFAASYAQRAISFAAGQAGFALLVMVLYNLIEPAGWQVGLIRIQDVAIGCGVSLVVGFLIWPRGAAELIRGAISDALVAGAELVRERSRGVLEGRPGNTVDQAWNDSLEASELLDAALRRFLNESSGDHVDRESLVALGSASLRLRRTAYGIGQIPEQSWYGRPTPEVASKMSSVIDEACDSYLELGREVESRGSFSDANDLGDPSWLLGSLADAKESEVGGVLAQIWLFENLQYLTELHHRFEKRAKMLYEVSSENPPPTGDVPMPTGQSASHPLAAQSG